MADRRYCIRETDGCGDKWCTRDKGEPCPYEYDESRGDPKHNYRGPEWPPPKRWVSLDGTHVYRTYADYCDD